MGVIALGIAVELGIARRSRAPPWIRGSSSTGRVAASTPNEQPTVEPELQQVEVAEQELIADEQPTVEPELQQVEVAEQELIAGEEQVVQEEPQGEEYDLI
uniref:Uncharacterized protein n=1 Tax=Zea mays TaxID=4577 RepID=B6TSM2_MAIZE|nr:hypothetical protein [Zea mays]